MDAADQDGSVMVTPNELDVVLVCPDCDERITIHAKFHTRLTRDQGGDGALALRTKAAKAAHRCGEPTLGLAEGERER